MRAKKMRTLPDAACGPVSFRHHPVGSAALVTFPSLIQRRSYILMVEAHYGAYSDMNKAEAPNLT